MKKEDADFSVCVYPLEIVAYAMSAWACEDAFIDKRSFIIQACDWSVYNGLSKNHIHCLFIPNTHF